MGALLAVMQKAFSASETADAAELFGHHADRDVLAHPTLWRDTPAMRQNGAEQNLANRIVPGRPWLKSAFDQGFHASAISSLHQGRMTTQIE